MTRHHRSRLLIGAVGALAAVSLTACVRLDTPPPPERTPTVTTVERDELAASLDDVAVAMAAGATGGGAEAVESRSLDALVAGVGERYVAYPELSPSPSPSEAFTGVADAASAALSTSVGIATTTEDDDLRAWAVSASLVHGLALWVEEIVDETVTYGTFSRDAASRPLPLEDAGTEAALPGSTVLDAAALADLALRHDQARYLYELVATRLEGAERADALARAAIHAERSDALQALAGGDDARSSVYSSSADAVADEASQAATLREAEAAVASAYAGYATSSGADDVLWLMDGAFDAYAAESLLSGWTIWDLPVLPGLDKPAAASTDG